VNDNPHRTKLQINASPNPTAAGQGDLFEITIITPGDGNGWKFSPAVLEKSVPLWNGAECFIDHSWSGQSLHDLAGVIFEPTYNGGVRAKLRAAGPSGPLLQAIAREMLGQAQPKPKIGFSADVLFTANDKQEVTEIVKVYSTDLVFDPARGGAFIRALNQAQRQKGNAAMSTNTETPAVPDETPAQVVDTIREEFQTLLSVQQEKEKQHKLLEETRAQMSGYLLDAALQAAQLVAPMEAHVRKQFAGRAFEPSELTAAISDARKLTSELATPGSYVSGPAVHSMFDTRDQLQAAVDDMLQAPREKGAENLKVARLSGIKELYLAMTGDRDFYGAYYAERAQFQHTTATFTGLVKNAMNKALIEHWGKVGQAGYDWWQQIATVEHFDTLNGITWVILGTAGALPSVSEGAEYTEIVLGDSPETSSFTKYGGYVGITLEALDRDDTRKLRAIPKELANAAIRNISSLCAAIFSANTYIGPTLADGGALFNNTAVTTLTGHANLTATALGATYAAWDALSLLVYNQPLLVRNDTGYYGTGTKMAIDPSICLVCRTLKPAADTLFLPRWASDPYQGGAAIPLASAHTWGGRVTPVTVPEWTSTTAWMAVVDPVLMPGVMIGERFGIMPEVFIAGDEQSPAVFMNDESRIKVRHFIAVGVCDFRPLGRGNV
jgi:hypothetical protein